MGFDMFLELQRDQQRLRVGETLSGFVVVDFSKVPDDFKTVDETKIRAAYREGVREIPGLKIMEETRIVVR